MGENRWSSEEEEEEEDAVVPELVSMDGEEEEEEEVTFLPVDRRLYPAVHDFLEVRHSWIIQIDHS